MATENWNVPGDNPLAAGLRQAGRFVDADRQITVLTEPGQSGQDAFALGPAVLESNATRVVPFYAAFEAIETLKRALDAGEVGKVYGLFGSFRVERGMSAVDLRFSALLPIVALALDLLPQQVVSVFARPAPLFADDDAWFVTLRLDDETIVSLEAMASADAAGGREMLIEVTGSDRVLRAEPFRQSVVVERLGAAPSARPWWEDAFERYLAHLARRSETGDTPSIDRLRAVWGALLRSAESGERVTLPS
jgi:predicted dehydrogenase